MTTAYPNWANQSQHAFNVAQQQLNQAQAQANTVYSAWTSTAFTAQTTNVVYGSIGSGSNVYGSSIIGGTAATTPQADPNYWGVVGGGRYLDYDDGHLVVPKGTVLKLPDGSVLHVDDLGNTRLDDANAKVIYQANRMREFNPYVNASDLLAAFIRYLGTLGLNRADAGLIPVVLFINWLVIEAATVDGDPIPEDVVRPEMHPLFMQRVRQADAARVA